MPLSFEPGQGVVWFAESDRQYGIVTACDGETVEFAPLFDAARETRCFDEGGSKYDTDRYKVRPRGCPPPFTLTYGIDFGPYGAFIDADPVDRMRVDEQVAIEVGLCVSDDGDKSLDEVLANTLNPVWRDEKEGAKRPWEDPAAPVPVSAMDKLNVAMERDAPAAPSDGRQFGD